MERRNLKKKKELRTQENVCRCANTLPNSTLTHSRHFYIGIKINIMLDECRLFSISLEFLIHFSSYKIF